ncbi:MAG: SemiSWEET transporter [Cyanobacteriota bacterium]|nr:SemiSWEET transporter [Cyanobacteriota bacterium]
MNDVTSWIGLLAGCLTTASFFPQARKTWQSRSAEDFSWPYLLLFGVGIVMWDIYGILRHDLAITVANTVTILLISIIIVTKARYPKSPI